MFRTLTLVNRARAILSLGFVGLILLAVAVVNIADGGRAADIVPAFGLGALAVAAAAWLTRQALAREEGRRSVEELIRAKRAKEQRGDAENEEPEPSMPAPRTCASCASRNEPDAAFCKKCGTAIRVT
jgi:uncharacterized paraquat-inducible protein A